MRIKNIKKTLILSMFIIISFSVNVFAGSTTVTPIGKLPPTGNTTTPYPSKGGGSGTGSGSGGKKYYAPGNLGGKNNPYIVKRNPRNYRQYNTHVVPTFNSMSKGKGKASKMGYDFTRMYGVYLPKMDNELMDNNGKFYFVRWVYPTVTVTRNTKTKVTEHSRVNDFFQWTIQYRRLDTNDSWKTIDNLKLNTNALTYTAAKVGEYRIIYLPHQKITNAYQDFTNIKANAYYPYLGSTDTILNKTVASPKTYKVRYEWRNDYKQVWHFKVTEPGTPLTPKGNVPGKNNPPKPGGNPDGSREVNPDDLGVTSELVH